MITFKNVSYEYPTSSGVKSICDLNLHIKKGEFVVLCGKSGCGKTTVTRMINKLIPHFYEGELEGEVLLHGKNIGEEELANMVGICGSVFQNPKSQFFNLETDGELAFGCENLNLPIKEINKRVNRAVSDFELQSFKNRSIFQLSGGEKQQIACGSIYATNPEIYVLDEPSSNMDITAIKRFEKILYFLKNQGKTIVISEHRLYYLMNLADRFLYFENGTLEKQFTPNELEKQSRETLYKMGLKSIFLSEIPFCNRIRKEHEKSLKVQNLICKRNGMKVLDIPYLEFERQSVIAVIGENGAGKTTFAEALTGLIKCKGDIYFEHRKVKPNARIKASYVVMQDVNRQLFCSSVKEELMLNRKQQKEEEVVSILKAMNLEDLSERHPASLSGGQKQRVAICPSAFLEKKLIIYDEPTSGLDCEGMMQLSSFIQKIGSQKLATIVITHDYELIVSCCTHVLKLEKGSVSDFYILDQKTIKKLQRFFQIGKEKERSMKNETEIKYGEVI